MTARREGELTERSLIDAVGAEHRAGRRPVRIAVGTPALEARAHRILGGGGPLAPLQTIVAHVELDPELGDAWELREGR